MEKYLKTLPKQSQTIWKLMWCVDRANSTKFKFLSPRPLISSTHVAQSGRMKLLYPLDLKILLKGWRNQWIRWRRSEEDSDFDLDYGTHGTYLDDVIKSSKSNRPVKVLDLWTQMKWLKCVEICIVNANGVPGKVYAYEIFFF